jgi:CheY-like chemotaxis protein
MEVDLLIVEDDPEWVDLVIDDAQGVGLSYDVAKDLTEAIECVDCRRYNAALVDMSLNIDTSNRDGEKVIRVLDGLAEGTTVMVFSAHTTPPLASKLGLLFGTPVIVKQSSQPDDLGELLRQMVDRGIATRPRPATGQLDLRGHMSGIDWEIMLSKFPGSSQFLNRFLAQATSKFSPLIAPLDRPPLSPIRPDVLGGHYWSRRRGAAIALIAGHGPAVRAACDDPELLRQLRIPAGAATLSSRDRGGLDAVVMESDAERGAYSRLAWVPDDEENDDWLASLFETP